MHESDGLAASPPISFSQAYYVRSRPSCCMVASGVLGAWWQGWVTWPIEQATAKPLVVPRCFSPPMSAPSPSICHHHPKHTISCFSRDPRRCWTCGPSACVCVQVLTCFKTWDRTQVLLRQLLVSTDNLHVVVFDDMSDDDTKERAEAMGVAVLQPHTQRNVGMTVWCGILEGLSCFQSQSSPVQCRPVQLIASRSDTSRNDPSSVLLEPCTYVRRPR